MADQGEVPMMPACEGCNSNEQVIKIVYGYPAPGRKARGFKLKKLFKPSVKQGSFFLLPGTSTPTYILSIDFRISPHFASYWSIVPKTKWIESRV